MTSEEKLRSLISIRDQYSNKKSDAWDLYDADVTTFRTDDGDCWGFLFHHLQTAHYSRELDALLLDYPIGTIAIKGSRWAELYHDFCLHKVAFIRADGKDITSVEMILNQDKELE